MITHAAGLFEELPEVAVRRRRARVDAGAGGGPGGRPGAAAAAGGQQHAHVSVGVARVHAACLIEHRARAERLLSDVATSTRPVTADARTQCVQKRLSENKCVNYIAHVHV